MCAATRVGLSQIVLIGGLAATIPGLWQAAPIVAAEPVSAETLALGRELFTRAWVPHDGRSHGGDGLGPVYNERSCLGCHHQGGPGGAATGDKNIEIVSPGGDLFPAIGAFYTFGMSFGGAGFQYRFASNAKPVQPPPPNAADLAQIHAGFRDAPSVVLHRYGPDADYRAWREKIPGQHGAIFLRSSQRNPTPLFGLGLIEAIPDEVLEAAARRRFAGVSQIRGRVSRLSDGRIGRFGWKAQTATLTEFVLTAAAVELGLEVPGHSQAGDPRIPALAARGLDMNQDECNALAAYVRSLPPPTVDLPANPKDAQQAKAGGAVFKAAGCATCHLPRLGDVEGIYSDLLLHDMSPQMADTSLYGSFAARDPGAAKPAPAPAAAPAGEAAGRKPATVAAVQEWRTPPLWGLRDSVPYLHDGRAETVDQAIRAHGGQATSAAQKYAQLSARERGQLEAFLLSLAAPKAAD
jgi:CxxC motif-containing protein (DUF1111 family)